MDRTDFAANNRMAPGSDGYRTVIECVREIETTETTRDGPHMSARIK
jgi:hypothetical protein